MKKIIILLIALILPGLALAQAQKITCNVNVSKQSAWDNYEVTIKMIDLTSQKVIDTFSLDKSSQSKKAITSISKSFDCSQYGEITFAATFSPPIWEDEKDTVYASSQFWNIAEQMEQPQAGADKLVMNVTFPTDFVNVPSLIGN